jgi:predicted ATPase/class 3 adenylate cyclase/Tfp pilus assembly protein PilF
MADLPTGTVTFLFTDIEGSTKLWERNPIEMRSALARHDALLRAAIEHNDGAVFSTAGDAFCAAFPTASAALSAACDVQRALTREPWPQFASLKVRMALHAGAAEVRDNAYFGQPLNRVGRLLSAGHGGQVLLSLAAQELVRDSLPAGVTLRDMGERRLKDLIRPERVYQLVTPDLPIDFPPLNTLDARAHNLPIQSTSFVGRDREIQDVKALLRSVRLLTLTGSGGAGKTRLSLQVGADCIDEFADGVWFVELAPLTDPRLVAQTVATALGSKEQPGVALADTLTQDLKNKDLLLLLDNCEHMVQASAQLCQSLLAACTNVRILATSREALRVSGESVYRVPSLATPDPKSGSSVEALTQYAAVQLFIDRALAVKSSFQVNNANAPAVASICHRLDGIPLAIELAAVRVRSMSLEEVNQRLDQRFRLLTGGSRTALPRQQTLRSLIDWSYDLLNDAEKALLCRVSIFAGGWTLEAAEWICVNEGVDHTEVLDLLTSLIDKSLVVAEERNGVTRYRMLETVRQYARDRLQERGEEPWWRARHLAYFVKMAEDAEPQLKGADQQAWLDRLEMEHDNVRLALACSCATSGDATAGLRLASAFWRFWQVRGYFGEGRSWLSALLAAEPDGQDADARAMALTGAGVLAWQQGDYPNARALHEEALTVRRELQDQEGIAASLNNLGNVALHQGDIAVARVQYEESLAIRRELGQRAATTSVLNNLGVVAYEQGDYAAAWALHAENLAICRELGNQGGIAGSLNNLGIVAYEQGDYRRAQPLHEEALAVYRELGDRANIASTLNNLGLVTYTQGDYTAARSLHEACLAVCRELGSRGGIANSLNNLGLVAYAQGDLTGALALYEESLTMRRDLGDRGGIAWSLEGIADVASALAIPDRAARIWGRAHRLREETGLPLPPHERPRYDGEVATARAALGDDVAFDQAWHEGREMTLDQAIEYALAKPGAASSH